jgi:short-subunit dehydrogenase
MNKNYYNNKNILIIGASFGIGESLCEDLAKKGANLIITARSTDKINKLSQKLAGSHLAVTCDITNNQELSKLAQIISKKYQKIDIIIFCAGIYEPMNLENFNVNKAQEILQVNLTSFVNFIDKFLTLFKAQKIAHLAVISSVAGYFGMPNSLAYGAAKAGLSNLTESLFYELSKYKVKVQLINPGFVKTRLTAKNNFAMPNIISSQKAAKIILNNLPKNNFEIKFPLLFIIIMKYLSMLPYKLRFLLLKYVK